LPITNWRTFVPDPLPAVESVPVSYRLLVELPPVMVPFVPRVVVAVWVEDKVVVAVVVKVETPLPLSPVVRPYPRVGPWDWVAPDE